MPLHVAIIWNGISLKFYYEVNGTSMIESSLSINEK